jgi:hypothetical protein
MGLVRRMGNGRELFQLAGDSGQPAPSDTAVRVAPDRESRRARRRECIDKFRQRQRAARRWIEFVEIAKWCARSTTAAGADNEQRALELAYQRLANSVLQGEFEPSGRSKILYLDPRVMGDGMTPRWRLSQEQFEIAATIAAPSLPIVVLARCWLRRERAAAWLELNGYRLPPYLEADTSESAQPGTLVDTAIERVIPSLAPGADAITSQRALADAEPTADASATPAKPQRRRGPKPGTVDRFGDADRALYPELETLMRGPEKMTASAAALSLASKGRVGGVGTSTTESRATRLAGRYRREHR